MDKKKRLIQLTEGMLLCCVIVVMTLLCIGIIKKEVKNTKGKLTETIGWYRIQDNKKVQVDLNQKIKTDTQGKLVLYNDTIAQKYKGYLMTTKAAKYSVRIYAGDQLIYRYSDSNFHRNDQMKSKLSCDARIPEHGEKGTVIKIIYQNGSYQLDDILVGRGDVVMGFHVQQEIVGIVMIAIMFFLSFVALITGIYLKHFKLNSTRFLNIAAFLALSGIWFLSDSALAQEYTSFPALTGMIPFYGTIFEVGVLIFEQLLLTSIFVNLVEQAKTRSELEVYERLLKEDRMTGINNRTAFEEQLQDIEDHAQDYDNAALIFMDVDGLKNTNDLYGHNAGDELIISAALCIKNVFATYGKCYRIGGDEFCVLIFDSIENVDELLKQMDQEIVKYNRNNRYYLSIARGVSFLKDTEGKQKKISDWKYEADQDMYCNKKRRNMNDRL